MIQMPDTEETIRRGRQAEIAGEFLTPLFETMRENMVNKLINTSPAQREDVLALHVQLQALDALSEEIRQAITEGVDAAAIAEANNDGT